jgi:hypothetical protein
VEIKQLLDTTATELNKLKPTATEQLKPHEQDILYTTLSDLVNNQFRPWYCQAFASLGRERVLELASLARADGKDKCKYFSFLLKKENTCIK